MARQRCALTLIIVSTLVLVTVVTAFRLRDAPKSSGEVSARRNPLIEKCVDCESESDEESVHKVQTPSKLSYEQVKKAVKEKQQSLNERKHQQHQKVSKHILDDDEDDDDDSDEDDIEFSKIRPSKDIAQNHKKDKGKISHTDVKKSILPSTLRVNPRTKNQIVEDSGSDNDNDQDDDDDEDDNNADDDVHSADDKNNDDNGDDADSVEDEGDDDDDDEDGEDDDDSDSDDEGTDDESKDDKGSKNAKEKGVKFVAKHQSSVKINTFKKREDNRKNTAVNKQELVSDSEDGDENNNDDDNDDDSDYDSEDDKIAKSHQTKATIISKSVVAKSLLQKESSVKGMTLKKPENTKKVQGQRQESIDDGDDGDDEDDDENDEDSDDDNYEDNKELLMKKSKSSKIIIDISKLQKSESPKPSKITSTQRTLEKPDKLSPVKESPITESKTTVIPTTKQKNEQSTEKDKKDLTKNESKKDFKPNQEIKQDSEQSHDKEQKVLHHDNKKDHKEPESKAPKDVNKQKPKEEKKKVVVEKEVKKIAPKSEHNKTKEAVKQSEHHSEQKYSESKHEKEKEVLRHASDALFRKNNFLQSEFEDFYAFMPSFSPNFSRIHNAECRRQGQILMRQLRGTKLWALNMLDATGKVPSGILQGNGNQLGDFDQCLESKARVRLDSGHVVKIHGKYCLAQIDLRSDDPELQLPIHLAQSRNLVKSRIDDPGHFIPRFSSLNWGVCLPASCGPDEAEFVLRDSLRHYHLAGLNVRVNVDPLNCHTATEDSWEQWLEPETLITLSLFSVVLLIVLYATLKDYFARGSSSTGEGESSNEESEDALQCDEDKAEKETKNEDTHRKSTEEGIVASFSLYNSCSRLLRDGDAEDIACIHGVRAICSLALLLAHKIIPVANTPFSNRGQLTELSHTPLSLPLRMGWLYTDAFLLLSGALTAHRLSADMDGEAGMPWLRRYIARYVRLTPALLFSVLFYAYVWDKLGEGPLWGTLVSYNAALCQESWWWNILYVQNYFPFDVMCAPQTYQLALDMQLTLTAAALVWAVRSRPLPAAGALLALQAMTAYARYSTTSEHRLSLLIYHGASVSQLYRTARLTYTSTLHRSTPYVVGVLLGVLLQSLPRIQLSMLVTIPCWLLCMALSAGTAYAALDAASPDTRYSASAAATYAAFAPAAAAAALAWFIYAAHSGNAQRINQMLCVKPLVLISRLSYAMYLCQFVVFFSNAATVKTSTEFNIFSIIDIQELITILVASTVMTVTLVIPMQSLSKYVMSYKFESTKETIEEPQENAQEETITVEEVVEDQPPEPEEEIEEVTENYNSHRIMAHRELLEEIMEAEIEYESQRDGRDEGLEEILEEEEDELGEEEIIIEEDAGEEDMEVVERAEVEGEGGEDFWGQQEEVYSPRSRPRTFNSRGSGEWEWSGDGQGSSSRYR